MNGYNPYSTIPQQQQGNQQQQGINPQQALQGLNIAKQFGAFGGGQAASSSSAAGGGGSAVASAGPWAALAAIIIANEKYASDAGYRSEDPKQYQKDLFTGEVFHQDVEKRFLPKIGIKEGSKSSKLISSLGMPIGTEPGKSLERLKGIFS